MSDIEIKLNNVLKFDAEKEKDIIDQIEGLASKRKLGEFISNMLRVAIENPEFIKKADQLSSSPYGITDSRGRFFDKIETEINKMKHKIDDIFDMTIKLYTLALLGKKLGIDRRSANLMQASFILQKQTDELCNILGISNMGHMYEANKLDLIKSKAEGILEYIIDAYDGIIAELRAGITVGGPMIYDRQDNLENRGDGSSIKIKNTLGSNTGNIVSSMDTTKKGQKDKIEGQSEKEDSGSNSNSELLTHNEGLSQEETSDNEVIDFGSGADLDLLKNFV